MKRKIYDRLLQWKKESNGRSAALIQGAPCTGKSFITEAFAKAEYRSYIRIDFTEAGETLKRMFLYDMDDLDTFFLKLQVLFNTKLYRRNSLIIFDEVQWFPRVRSAIEHLVKDGRFDYIETGNLLAIKESTKGIRLPSHVERLRLYPMDFEEFLWATGHEHLLPVIRRSFTARAQMGAALHYKAMDMLRQYLIVGGMPAAVAEYVRSGNLATVDKVKRSILQHYRESIRRYARRHAPKATEIFEKIPTQMLNRNQHFKFSALRAGARYSLYKEPLFWLEDAMLVHCCYNVADPLTEDSQPEKTVMKCYMLDTGLLLSLAFDEPETQKWVHKDVLLGNLEETMPMLLENMAAQMLTAAGYKLRFYNNVDSEHRTNRMELDFLLTRKRPGRPDRLLPIKVKTGKNYKRSALRKFKAKFCERVDEMYDFHTGDVKTENDIVFLPLYMAMLF